MRNPSSSNKKKSAATTTITPCCSKVGLKRGPWTPEEDEVLSEYIRKEGEGRWRTLPKRAGLLRCGKSCRLRWMNYLRPNVKRGQIAADEEDLILRLHRLLGNRWSLIAGRIPGRTDNEIKNYWNTHLSKKLISQGIDPRTHKPLNPPGPSSSATTPLSKPFPPIIPNLQTPFRSSAAANQEFDPPFRDDHFDQYQQQDDHEAAAAGNNNNNNNIPAVTDNDGCDNFNDIPASDVPAAMDHLLNVVNNNREYDDTNYCCDDVFTSFLDSLINEDAFAAQRHLQSEINPINGSDHDDHVAVLPSDDLLISPAYGLGGVVGWESPLLMSAAFAQNDPNPAGRGDGDHHHE